MAKTTYEIVLSTDGKQSVIVQSDDRAEINAAAGWAKATYEALVARYGMKNASKQTKPQDGEAETSEPAPICAVHQVPMARVQGRRGPFWSCHERVGEGWCRYRPPEEQRAALASAV